MAKGLFIGNSHANGGIPSEIAETGTKIEIEGNEYYICNEAYNSPNHFDFKKKTNKEILDFIYTEFACKLNQDIMHSGDFIVCKVVVADKKKKDRKGTIKQILNEMQGEKNCKVESSSNYFKQGGSIFQNEGLYIIISEVNSQNKYKGAYRQIFDLIEKDIAFHNPYGTDYEELKGNDFHIYITPRPDSNIIEKISKIKNVKVLDKYKQGGELIKRADGSYSKTGLWDNIRANIGSGRKPTKEMLKQEAIIREKYHLGGDMSKHLAPNGKPSNLTHEQWHLVRTDAFKQWFGDWEKLAYAKFKDSGMDEVTLDNLSKDVSKVVDENGEPMVLFHGTDVNFNVYDLNKTGEGSDLLGKGIYLTENKEIANFYANLVAKKRYIKGYEQGIFGTESPLYEKDADIKAEKHKVIYDFFVNAKNIGNINEININNDIKEILAESISFMFGDKSEDIINSRIDFVDKNNNKIKNYRGKIIYLIEQFPDAKNEVLEYIKNKYDCIVFEPTNEFEGATSNYKNYVVFNSNQIKLADGTNTAFDSSNPDIRYKEGGKLELYHGSQKKFKNFKTNLVERTDYGWGIYFTDSEDVAKFYARRPFDRDVITKKITESKFNIDEKYLLIDTIRLNLLDLEKSKKTLDKKYYPLINQIQKEVQNKSFVYESNVLNKKWLYWDKKVSVDIKKIFKNIDEKYFKSGETFYNYLTDKQNSQKNASLFLLNKGIVGIKYLISNNGFDIDGYNYVLFDVNDIEIKEIYKYDEGGNIDAFDLYSVYFPSDEEMQRINEKIRLSDEQEKEDEYQRSKFSKKWAATRKIAIDKLVQQYLDAKKTYDDWASRQYKENKTNVFLSGDDIFGESKSIGSINEGRKRKVLRGSKMLMEESISDLKEIGLKNSEIDNLINKTNNDQQTLFNNGGMINFVDSNYYESGTLFSNENI